MEQEVYGSVVEQPVVGTTTFHFAKTVGQSILRFRIEGNAGRSWIGSTHIEKMIKYFSSVVNDDASSFDSLPKQ